MKTVFDLHVGSIFREGGKTLREMTREDAKGYGIALAILVAAEAFCRLYDDYRSCRVTVTAEGTKYHVNDDSGMEE